MKTVWTVVGRKEDGQFLVSMSKMTKIPKDGKIRTHWVSDMGVLLDHNKSTDCPTNKLACDTGKAFVFMIIAKSIADAQRLLYITNNVGENVIEDFTKEVAPVQVDNGEPKDLFGHLKAMQVKLDKLVVKLKA